MNSEYGEDLGTIFKKELWLLLGTVEKCLEVQDASHHNVLICIGH